MAESEGGISWALDAATSPSNKAVSKANINIQNHIITLLQLGNVEGLPTDILPKHAGNCINQHSGDQELHHQNGKPRCQRCARIAVLAGATL
jgi:hypothetical protein